VDFTENVDFSTGLTHWRKNSLRGRIGDQPVSKDDKLSMLWETGNSWTQRNTVKTCSYDNTDCYEARTVPVIFDISQNTGYLTGGQNLTVRGFGFNHKKIDVKIDGAPCTVTRYMDDKFDCQVSSKAEISKIDTPQLGQHGVKRSYWKGGNWKVDKPKYSTLHTNMETYHNSDDSYSS